MELICAHLSVCVGLETCVRQTCVDQRRSGVDDEPEAICGCTCWLNSFNGVCYSHDDLSQAPTFQACQSENRRSLSHHRGMVNEAFTLDSG